MYLDILTKTVSLLWFPQQSGTMVTNYHHGDRHHGDRSP